ncbi:hypothetical protein [Shewanella goraebulensis]|uniref:hypothetical protein n=1 Tax=Shewanella goraebulensis TaxID=3050637 RepID=UPI00254D18B4|nr:hypothetical protein [Shewanella goraebulensis]
MINVARLSINVTIASLLLMTVNAFATEVKAISVSVIEPVIEPITESGTESGIQQCSRTSHYDIYLSGLHTGTMKRTESWQGDEAVVTSESEASILGIGTQYNQRAELFWSDETDEWVTEKFHQLVTGFRARDMKVEFSQDGLSSEVDIDGDKDQYESSHIPLRDVDTLAIQMRQFLLQGRSQFALIRQASDAIEPYQLYVKPAIKTQIAPWGEIKVIPVEQSGAETVTYYFAPDMDFQLVKARYHGFILQGVIEMNAYTTTCEPIVQ